MSLEIWPSNEILPDPNTSLGANADTSTLRLDMEDGRSRQRQRYSVDRLVVNCTWLFTTFELRIFEAFLKYKLNEGTDAFLMPLNLGGGNYTYTLRFIGGEFNKTYVDSGYWTVTAQLETANTSSDGVGFGPTFCISNVTSFLTVPEGYIDLGYYFNTLKICSSWAATQWRIIEDECFTSPFQITWATGAVNDDGTLNPAGNTAGPPDNTGLDAATCFFWSFYSYPEGLYLQVNCHRKWARAFPCVAGGM